MDKKQLIVKLLQASAAYYAGEPVMDDDAYDALRTQLQTFADAGDVVAQNVLLQVGAQVPAGSVKVTHQYPMKSLDNCYNPDEFEKFARRFHPKDIHGYVVEPKLDGLALSLEYRNGVLAQATTRGDGMVGEDVTVTALAIPSIPRVIPTRARVVFIRGEVVIEKKVLEDINKTLVEAEQRPYANARNAAAGILRSKEPDWKSSKLLFVAYDTTPIPEESAITSRMKLVSFLNAWFQTPPTVWAGDPAMVKDIYDDLVDRREHLPYEADGAVVKINALQCQKDHPGTSHAPGWAIAWKFESQKAATLLRAITHQVGRTGRITPVAELKPVELAGVVVRRATLHNYKLLAERDIRPGDEVLIERAGDVIPEVVKTLGVLQDSARAELVQAPGLCPQCGSLVRYEGDFVYCSAGEGCRAQLVQRLLHWCGRGVAEVDGFGEKMAETLVEADLVVSVADLYKLSPGDLTVLPGVGAKTEKNILDQIAASLSLSLDRFIFGLGVPSVGKTTATQLAEVYGSWAAFAGTDVPTLEAVPGIGEKSAFAIIEALSEMSGLINELFRAGVSPVWQPPEVSDALAGETVVFTGALPVPRAEAQEAVKSLGAKVTGSVSPKTTLVVVGDNPGAKYNKAMKLGVRVIDYAEFCSLTQTT